ncbi:hypothetical protein ACH5AG_21210 [Streptomyces anulatus]|uniref:hypothetical protein n=1 Tax=Streptomyces anulatus TaxID=1892 RepID=UPI00378A6512
MSSPGSLRLVLDKVAHAGHHRVAGGRSLLRSGLGVQGRRNSPSHHRPLLLGHAEQVTDQTVGNLVREPRTQVDGFVRGRGGHFVEQVVDDLFDGGPQFLDPARGKGLADQAAQPFMVGSVGGEHGGDVDPRVQPRYGARYITGPRLAGILRHVRVAEQLLHDIAAGDGPGGDGFGQLDAHGRSCR